MNEKQIRAADAQALLANPVFQGALEALRARIESNMLSANADDFERCTRLVITKQLLAGVVREINNYIEEGEIADFVEISELPEQPRQFKR